MSIKSYSHWTSINCLFMKYGLIPTVMSLVWLKHLPWIRMKILLKCLSNDLISASLMTSLLIVLERMGSDGASIMVKPQTSFCPIRTYIYSFSMLFQLVEREAGSWLAWGHTEFSYLNRLIWGPRKRWLKQRLWEPEGSFETTWSKILVLPMCKFNLNVPQLIDSKTEMRIQVFCFFLILLLLL